MLQQVKKYNDASTVYIHFNDIQPGTHSGGVCFVQSGKHRYTKYGKPYISLVLQDVDGNVIPGYIFDLADFNAAGVDLTATERRVVLIQYMENFLSKYGMTVIVDKLAVIEDATPEQYGLFVGSCENANKVLDELMQRMSDKLGIKVTIPYTSCTLSHEDYAHGAVGGLVFFYRDLLNLIEVYQGQLTDSEMKSLYGTFLVYLFVHSNVIENSLRGTDNIQMVARLFNSMPNYIKALGLTSGVMEVVTLFQGVTPKDLFVRIIKDLSDNLVRLNKMISVYRTLPDTREGDAYGTIKKYVKD